MSSIGSVRDVPQPIGEIRQAIHHPAPSTKIVPTSTYLSLPREAETWLVRPLIPTGGAALLFGDPKIGKSFAAMQLANAIADPTQTDWMGFPIALHGPVVYVQLDTPRGLWATRIDALAAGGINFSNTFQADRETLDCWPFDITDPRHRALLAEAIAGCCGEVVNTTTGESSMAAPVAVIIDTLREAHSGDENDSTAMRNAISGLVAATQPAALILISHARKPMTAPDGSHHKDLMSDNRGSSYTVGRMDAIIRFTRKHIFYTGRAIEEGSIKTQRLDNGFWRPDHAELDAQISQVQRDKTKSLRERAKELSTLSGKSEEACRSMLRRNS